MLAFYFHLSLIWLFLCAGPGSDWGINCPPAGFLHSHRDQRNIQGWKNLFSRNYGDLSVLFLPAVLSCVAGWTSLIVPTVMNCLLVKIPMRNDGFNNEEIWYFPEMCHLFYILRCRALNDISHHTKVFHTSRKRKGCFCSFLVLSFACLSRPDEPLGIL